MFLFFGWGCVIWQPLALQYGKRPVYLFSMLATLVPTLFQVASLAPSNIILGDPDVVTLLQD